MAMLKRTSVNHHFYSSNRNGELFAATYIGSQWMMDKQIYEPKQLEYLQYEESTVESYGELFDPFSNDAITSMDTARRVGVEREWEVYRFFASEEVAAPESVFQYVDDDGKMASFTKEEIALIAAWEKGERYPLEGIEGHHMELVSQNPDNIDLAADPNNILMATSEGHHLHLHAGNYHNETAEKYFDLQLSSDDKLAIALEHNKSEMLPSLFSYGLASVGGSVALFASVGMIAETIRLRKDPRPWLEKRREVLQKGISFMVVGGALGIVGYGTKVSMEQMLADIPIPVLEQAFSEILVLNGAFFTVQVASGYIKYLRDRKNGVNIETAKKDFQRLLQIAAIELAVFQGIGVGATMISEMATDTLVDAFIPDPTFIFIGARILYGIGKAGKALYDTKANTEAFRHCRKIRYSFLFEEAFYGIEHNHQPRLGM